MRPEETLKALTPDAFAALGRRGMSRRGFIKGSGRMIVGFSVARLASRVGQSSSAASAQGINGLGSNQLDSWIAVGGDDSITAYTGKCELGQGLHTAQTQLIAEELGVNFDRVTLIQSDTARTPDQGTTSGAQSHPANFNHENLALACATAREVLLAEASTRLGVPVEQLEVNEGVVRATGNPSRMVGYGELVGGRTFSVDLNPEANRRDPSEWTVLGQPIPRLEIPAMATGQFEYVHNVRMPGMLHGQVVRPPRVGATLVDVDEGSIQDLPGVVQVVVRGNFVGIVADKPWQTIQAANQLSVDWTPGTGLPSQEGFYEYVRSDPSTRDTFLVDSGDVDARIDGATDVLEATYYYPYQMHGSIGSSCAVADVGADGTTIWSATQAVYPLKNTVAMLLDLNPEDVHIMFRMGSGCYGVNGADTVSYDAALLSAALGRPVRVQLTRKDEMAWENYGLAFVIDQRAGLDPDGTIVAWDHESWSPVLDFRPGYRTPGNVVTGFLAGFEPEEFVPRAPAPDPTGFDNGSNEAPSYVTGCVEGSCGGTGVVASERVLMHVVQSPFFTGPLRSPERLQNTFAHESFIDEIATFLGQDPVEYRLRHLGDPRLVAVVRAAADSAGWQSRPSPRAGISRSGIAPGRGISCVFYEGDNGYCAMVVEVEVHQDTGAVVVTRLVIANDCGPISNPDGLRNQLEGGALHGISRTLLEEVTWDSEKVTSIDWRTYSALYLGPDVPEIETVLINPTEGEAMGAGATAVTLVAAAIGNAVFDATGARIRQVPFTPGACVGRPESSPMKVTERN